MATALDFETVIIEENSDLAREKIIGLNSAKSCIINSSDGSPAK
jgi:hypothetical protein